MAPVDWIIVIVIALAVLGGISQGFFRSVCSLGGLVLGLILAAWNYRVAARILLPLVRIEAVADTIGFLIVAILVMAIAGIIGNILSKTFHYMGLGCLDRLAGGVFGFFQGALLVMLGVLVTLAFFPHAHWLADARLPRDFFGACHVTTHLSPTELAERVRSGLRTLEEQSPRWMHPENGGL
jgi:membrane protein required for colicin V production